MLAELLATDKRANALRESLASLDATIKLFAPDVRPAAIRPRGKRPPARFKAGELARVVLAILRDSASPMTNREIVERVAADHQVDISTKKAMSRLDYSVRSALSRQRTGVNRSVPDNDVMTWSAE